MHIVWSLVRSWVTRHLTSLKIMTEYRETGWNIDNFSLLKPARNLKLRQFSNVQYCKDRVERQNTIYFFFTHFLYMYSNSKWQILKTFDDQEFGYWTSLNKMWSQAQSIGWHVCQILYTLLIHWLKKRLRLKSISDSNSFISTNPCHYRIAHFFVWNFEIIES